MNRILLAIVSFGLLWPEIAISQFIGTTPRVYYYPTYNPNNPVEELWWDRADNTWHARANSQEAKAPAVSASFGLPTGFGVGPDLDPQVYYTSVNSQLGQLQVEQLAWIRSDNTWQARNISQEVHAPGINFQSRNLAGFGVGINRDPRVYYVDTSNHVQELAWFSEAWHVRDISQGVNAPNIVNCPVAFGVGANLDPRVYCVDTTDHIQELAWISTDNTWHMRDISQEAGAPTPITGIPVGFGVGANFDPRVYYFSGSSQLEELAWNSTDNTWHARDILRAANALPRAGTELPLVGFAAGRTIDPRLYYVDEQRQAQQLAWSSIDQMWHARAISQPGSIPPASFGAGCAVGANLDPRVYYFDANRQVQELAGNSTNDTWQTRAIGQEANAPPEAPTGPLLAFGVDARTVRLDGGNFQSVVDENPAGTTFVIGAGVHRMQQVVPKDGDVFVGEPGAVMKGSLVLTGWKPDDTNWVATLAKDIVPGIKNGDCSDLTSQLQEDNETGVHASVRLGLSCTLPEMLFVTDSVNGRVLVSTRVKSLSEVGPGKWYFDYTSPQKVYTKDDYSSKIVELGVTRYAFGYDVIPGTDGAYSPDRKTGDPLPSSSADVPDPYDSSDKYAYKPRNVTIRNLIIEEYANPAQTGVIGYQRPGLDWVIIGNEVKYNHGSGIKFKGNAIVRGNYTHHNGEFGIEAGDGNTTAERGGELQEWGFFGGYGGSGGLVEANEIAHNRLAEVGIEPGWGAGGTKFSQCFNLVVRDNRVHDNHGPGLWSDFSYSGTIYAANDVRNNDREGIEIETTLGPTQVLSNTVNLNSSYVTEADIKGSQIYISNSPEADVHDNSIVAGKGYGNGITIANVGNRNVEGVPVGAVGNNIHDNDLTLLGDGNDDLGITGGQGEPDQEIPQSKFYDVGRNTFHHNAYHVRNNCSVGKYWRWDRPPFQQYPPFSKFVQWQGYQQDTSGSCDSNIRF
jgi:hypothetical protein